MLSPVPICSPLVSVQTKARCNAVLMFSMHSVDKAELCPVLTVTKAGYADCDGEYELTSWKQAHGRFRQVYKNTVKDRY